MSEALKNEGSEAPKPQPQPSIEAPALRAMREKMAREARQKAEREAKEAEEKEEERVEIERSTQRQASNKEYEAWDAGPAPTLEPAVEAQEPPAADAGLPRPEVDGGIPLSPAPLPNAGPTAIPPDAGRPSAPPEVRRPISQPDAGSRVPPSPEVSRPAPRPVERPAPQPEVSNVLTPAVIDQLFQDPYQLRPRLIKPGASEEKTKAAEELMDYLNSKKDAGWAKEMVEKIKADIVKGTFQLPPKDAGASEWVKWADQYKPESAWAWGWTAGKIAYYARAYAKAE